MKLEDGREISASLACTVECCEIVSTPMCNGCKLWHRGKHSCKKYPQKIPESIRFEEYHECPDFELIAPSEINYKSVKANIERLKK